MSDPQYGDPVDETASDPKTPAVDDVVGSANANLAEAEAASYGAVEAPASETADASRGERDFSFSDRGSDLSIDYDAYAEPDAPAATTPVSSEPLYRPELADDARATDAEPASAPAEAAPVADEAPTTVVAAPTAVTASEPVPPAAPTQQYAQPAMQPIFVQAPEPPRERGNRGAIAGIGLLAALVFALIYLAASVGLVALTDGFADVAALGEGTLEILLTAAFWVPVAVFYVAFWVLGAFINRGRWGLWVILGLLVGLASYGGHLLGQLFQAPFWTLTASQGAEIVSEQLLSPLAVVALVAGREITIWFGAWAAARGRRVTELNAEAQREYERTLEAGPQLHQA